MRVNPPDAAPGEPVGLYELNDLSVLRHLHLRQGREEVQNLASATQGPARQLPDDEGMAPDAPLAEASGQSRMAPPKVVHPDRCVNEHAGPWPDGGGAGP